jgi:tRNA modification GTPase
LPDTIFALSSGALPAGIAVVRISGPGAGSALEGLAGPLPAPRTASLRAIRGTDGALLDRALTLWCPGPASATGEDLAELHLHGGRAIVAAVLAALAGMAGLRHAEAGEFTRRGFDNGRIDLAEAEGLADLLAAETEGQRRAAILMAEGALGRQTDSWRTRLLAIAGLVEAELDFADESDVAGQENRWRQAAESLASDLAAALATPPAERLRDGIRVVLAGPPNAGKSSLFNALVERDAAIVTPIAGTTRDRIEAPIALDGVPLLLTDTAGLRDDATDAVEAIGIARSEAALAEADLILWLGEARDAPEAALLVATKADLETKAEGLSVSVVSGEGLSTLRAEILTRAKAMLPPPDSIALNARHRDLIGSADEAINMAATEADLLIVAEHLRSARHSLDRITGRAGVEDMLDALFGQFCVGK